MLLKIIGKTTSIRINSICVNHYRCEPTEFEISRNFAVDQSVNIMHSRPVDGTVMMTISANNMSVDATFLPPINGGRAPTYEEALALVFSPVGVTRSFADENAFKEAYEFMLKGSIVDGAIVAVGKQPVHGKDAKVQIFFEIPSDKPMKDASGKTYFKQQRRFINVKTDQVLARITPATEGEPGMTVNSNPIPQVPGKPAELTAGDGVKTDETGTQFSAAIDGYIVYKQGILSIQPVIEVKGDVDYSVGNIDFVGTVDIKGDVLSGFVVKGKDINIGGICQDATITAENNVTIKAGVKGGKNNSSISAGGNIEVGYCESGNLSAKGSIIIHKYAFNSILNAGDMVKADTKSTVAGGVIAAFAGCMFYNLGTRANTKIEISVGRKYDADNKLTRITDEKNRLLETIDKMNEVLGVLDAKDSQAAKNPKYKKFMETRDLITKRLALFDKRIESIMKESIHRHPVIEVENEVQEGVSFRFFDTPYVVRSVQKRVRFTFDSLNMVVDYHQI